MELNGKRRRNKKWTAEMSALADHLCDNYTTLFGSFDSSNEITKTKKNSIWQSVTEIVNSMGNCRDRDALYRKSIDMKPKSLTKKKLIEQVKDRNRTGRRPGRKDLQRFSWEIASVIPRESVYGLTTPTENGTFRESEIYLGRFLTENIEKSSVQSRSYETDKSACVDAPPVKRKMEVKRKENNMVRRKQRAACTFSAELMDVERGILQESKQRNELLKELELKMDAMLAMKQEKMRIVKGSQLLTNDDSFVYI